MDSNISLNKYKAPLGSVEPHAGLLTAPNNDQLIYKIIRMTDLIKSISKSYLHFTRIDSYKDFDEADSNDGGQSPKDLQINENIEFERSPGNSISDYYKISRNRTYACCFSIENSDYIWTNYGTGDEKGKVCIIFNFGRLRSMLNEIIENGQGLLYKGKQCHQIFSINYGLVEYLNWKEHISSKPPNPIKYTYQKDKNKFGREKELRVSLSAIGVGKFVMNNGDNLKFPPSFQISFDFKKAIHVGAIKQFQCSKHGDSDYLTQELKKFGINSIIHGVGPR